MALSSSLLSVFPPYLSGPFLFLCLSPSISPPPPPPQWGLTFKATVSNWNGFPLIMTRHSRNVLNWTEMWEMNKWTMQTQPEELIEVKMSDKSWRWCNMSEDGEGTLGLYSNYNAVSLITNWWYIDGCCCCNTISINWIVYSSSLELNEGGHFFKKL